MKHFHVKRLQRTLDNVHKHLKAWRQSSWMESPDVDTSGDGFSDERWTAVDTRTCGTAGCLAGWGAVDAGAKFVASAGMHLEYVAPRGHIRSVLNGDEEPTHVRYFARTWFGLDDAQASAQFDSDNDYERLWALAMLFTGGRLTLPAEVTQEQADAAAEQGSNAYATDNFPNRVHAEMQDLTGGPWPVVLQLDQQLDPEIVKAALAAAKAQADARELLLVRG